jgi:hypothetical protein
MIITPCFVMGGLKSNRLQGRLAARPFELLAASAVRRAAPGFEQPSRSNALRVISILCLFVL